MRETYIIFLVAIATCLTGGLSEDAPAGDALAPEKRLISTFQIVRFPNDACIGSSSRNGTCYTSAECSDKGGSSSGSCADGFGVCCTFVLVDCDAESSQNITYWDVTPTVSALVPSSCRLKISMMNSDICQLRIDFTTFVITGPSSATIFEAHHQLNDIPKDDGGVRGDTDTNWRSNCLLDTFSVNGKSSANNPPTICGTNTGYHMYVDADTDGNTLMFHFSALPGSTPLINTVDSRGLGTLASRDWDMTVYQYECGGVNNAPPGCTQYFWGTTKGLVTSYNWSTTGQHLANQWQKVCIRRERAYCYACFARNDAIATYFNFSGKTLAAGGQAEAYVAPGQACGYACEGANGIGAITTKCGSYDCVQIPGAFVVANQNTGVVIIASITAANIRTLVQATYQVPIAPQISSGGAFGIAVANNAAVNAINGAYAGNTALMSICTKHVPFMMTFKSDSYEGQGEGGEYSDFTKAAGLTGTGVATNTGININYELISCT